MTRCASSFLLAALRRHRRHPGLPGSDVRHQLIAGQRVAHAGDRYRCREHHAVDPPARGDERTTGVTWLHDCLDRIDAARDPLRVINIAADGKYRAAYPGRHGSELLVEGIARHDGSAAERDGARQAQRGGRKARNIEHGDITPWIEQHHASGVLHPAPVDDIRTWPDPGYHMRVRDTCRGLMTNPLPSMALPQVG